GAGATLCLARQEELLPGPGLIDLLRRHAISVVTLPPSVLAATSAEALPDLHTVMSAGEACTADIVSRWGAGRRLVNGFGPTEDTVCATAGRCETESGRPSIGRPLPGKQVYVLDAHMQPVPIGVNGELYIGGVGLARCYLNRPDLTAERFVANPFAAQPGARLYKTGDLCAWRVDGNLDFRGRIDHQVKIRAFRIELGEVETALTAHPGVRQAVAIAREDVPGEPRLVAYVVPEGEPRPSVTELRSFLRTMLPDYMVPAAFIFLDTLPISPNGKVDRKALPAPERLRPNLDRPYVAPRTEAERVLAEIWAEVLGVEKVGVHDNYFELGGASINSLRIVARASEASLSINAELLKPELLFEHPTVAELAELVSISREPAEQKARESVLGEGPPTPLPVDRRPLGP
ncbi:MAG: AMP-binding protein, partial [Planctomycetes bacterium]|nr:AMP-binding protein [Planctomycetota bacterium]